MHTLSVVNALKRLGFRQSPVTLPFQRSHLSSRRHAPNATDNDDDIAAARRWLAAFNPDTIPRDLCDISFSRSSGPGGQNVNKVSSKATLRLSLSSLLPLLPNLLHQEMRSSRYYANNSNSLVIQSDDSRKQNDNVHSCFVKLHRLIEEAGRKVVPGETSEAQKERVRKLEKASNEARLRSKKTHSQKKSSRKGGSPDY